LKEEVEDSEDMRLEEGREESMAVSKEKNDEGEPLTFKEKGSFKIPKSFPISFLT